MKIFVSYSSKDYDAVAKIVDSLVNAGHSVWIDKQQVKQTDNLFFSIQKAINESDIVLAIITDNFNNSLYASAELGAVLLGSSASKLLTIVIGDANIPSYMTGYAYKKYNIFNQDIAKDIIEQLKDVGSYDVKHPIVSEEQIKKENENKYIEQLQCSLNNNRLTLVCGAGISTSAGIPSWNELLLSMLNKSINDKYKFNIEDAKKFLPSSSIILGKYLKLMLGKDFEKTLKECLYDKIGEEELYLGKKVYRETDLIHAIVNLLRPKRNRGSIESVITFNFDSLIEDTLDKYGIDNQAIYDEGMVADNTKIPIYHVHGYLPQAKDVDKPNIVFSEETYHTQFIDPYNWSNLVQLYKYMENTCLLIGLSITDPNLRRLLDISKRKNEFIRPRHYIIKKKPYGSDDFKRTQMLLEEQDANSLGLNVFWIDEFEEIPNILNRIAT